MITPSSSPSRPLPSRQTRRSGALVALAVVCAVLFVVDLALGAVALWLYPQRSAAQGAPTVTQGSVAASSSPSPAPTAPYTLGGVPVFTLSDTEVGPPVRVGREVYATVANPGQDAVSVYYDLTLLDAEGTILDRDTSPVGILAGQTTLLHWFLDADVAQPAEIRIEQIFRGAKTPPVTGTVSLDRIDFRDHDAAHLREEKYGSLVDTRLTSTLSAPVEELSIRLYLGGFVEDRLVAAGECSYFGEVPAEAAFRVEGCRIGGSEELPDDLSAVEFRVLASYSF